MIEPSPHSSRVAIAKSVAAILVVGVGGFVLGRSTSERPPSPAAPISGSVTAPERIPSDEPPRELGRADLITLANIAADDSAAKRATSPEVLKAKGRRFELRLPFGCNGAAAADSTAAMRWRYDPTEGVLRVHVAPNVWSASDWWTGAPPASVEAIEGFWIPRPWSSSDACPPADDDPEVSGAEPVTLSGQTLALAQFSTAQAARQGRRDGQPLAASLRVPADQFDSSKGFRIRITGRIAGVPGGGPILCRQPGGARQRPICLVATEIGEIVLENAANGDVLATWRLGLRDAGGA